MHFDAHQLAALLAIAETGTFDAAARQLQVTPSAISQRIKSLETSVGSVVLQRGAPCEPTATGELLLRLARQVRLLSDEVTRTLRLPDDPGSAPMHLPIAVNADSLATWFRPVLADIAHWPAVALDVHVDDQEFTADLLRRGDVLAAISSSPTAVQGCSVVKLGTMHYYPAAAPQLARTVPPGGDWSSLPVVTFNTKDDLQNQWHGHQQHQSRQRIVHRVPSSADFLEAVCLGLGWGAIPEEQLAANEHRLEVLADEPLAVPLFWQRWRLSSATLERLSERVITQAQAALH